MRMPACARIVHSVAAPLLLIVCTRRLARAQHALSPAGHARAHDAVDAIMGVCFFGEEAPDDFGSYDIALVTVFSMTAGNYWVVYPHVVCRATCAAFSPVVGSCGLACCPRLRCAQQPIRSTGVASGGVRGGTPWHAGISADGGHWEATRPPATLAALRTGPASSAARQDFSAEQKAQSRWTDKSILRVIPSMPQVQRSGGLLTLPESVGNSI